MNNRCQAQLITHIIKGIEKENNALRRNILEVIRIAHDIAPDITTMDTDELFECLDDIVLYANAIHPINQRKETLQEILDMLLSVSETEPGETPAE